MRKDHFVFGVDKRSTAIVAASMTQRPQWDKPGLGFANHLFLDELASRGGDFVRRLLGHLALGILRIHHPAAMKKYAFEPVTGTRLCEPDSNVVRLIPPARRNELLAMRVAVGLSASALSLEFAEHDDDRPLGMARGMPFRELEARGPNGAAATVGDVVLRTLTRQHPAAFAPFPGLCATP